MLLEIAWNLEATSTWRQFSDLDARWILERYEREEDGGGKSVGDGGDGGRA